jgi:hypothetical protein
MIRRLISGLAVAWLVAACGSGNATARSASESLGPELFSLYVANADGPKVDVLIASRVVATVECGSGIRLTEGVAGVPALPWSIEVRQVGGSQLFQGDVFGGDNETLLIRDTTVDLGQFGSAGPSTPPDACGRWSPSPVPS